MTLSHPRRIAVVGVHGVADQSPGDTARRCAKLLVRGGAFEAATETPLLVETQPLRCRLPPPTPEPADRLPMRNISLLSPAVQREIDDRGEAELEDEPPLEHLNFQAKLSGLEIPPRHRVLETVRVETRRAAGVECPAEVHVHELYWADLSRLGHRFLGVLISLYQFLFLLAALGADSVGCARAELQDREGFVVGFWRAYGFTHTVAVRLLSVVIPTLTLAMLALVTTLVADRVAGHAPRLWLWVLLSLAAGLVAVVSYRLHLLAGSRGSALALTLAVSAFGGVVALAVRLPRAQDLIWLAPTTTTVLWFVAMFGVWRILRALNRRIPGALVIGLPLLAGVSFYYVAVVWAEPAQWEDLFEIGAVVAVELIAIQDVAWAGLFGLVVLSTGCGWLAARFGTPADERLRAFRLVRTVALTSTVPALAMMTIHLALWAGLIELLGSWEPLLGSGRKSEMLDLWKLAVPPHYQIPLGLIGIAVVMGLWGITPSVLSDLRPRGRRQAQWHGRNLSDGFRQLGFAALVLQAAAFSLLVLCLWDVLGAEAVVDRRLRFLILGLGVALIAAVVGRGPLGGLAFGFRAALDVLLDVLNWLRHKPAGETPGGLIASRYVSLLRYLCAWRHPVDGGRYEAVVVVAHSQGTVITIDLMRFLTREWQGSAPPGLERLFDPVAENPLPLSLLTFGCPLQQLYGLMLPFRYGWARDGVGTEWPTAASPLALSDPMRLPIERWVNVYRSADYIGRHLWHPDAEKPGGETRWTEQRHGDDRREEVCLGAGGHNSYWGDRDSEGVARELAALIERVC